MAREGGASGCVPRRRESPGRAQLQGANLESASLKGANLTMTNARLEGANLESANLQGATLKGAQLQGAKLFNSELKDASFADAFVWTADAKDAKFKDTVLNGLEVDPKYRCHKKVSGAEDKCDWTTETFGKLKKVIVEHVPEGNDRRDVMDMIEYRFDPNKDLLYEDQWKKKWQEEQSSSSSTSTDAHEKTLEVQWSEMGCGSDEEGHFLRLS
jgi:pentapeptide repeat protein